MCSQKHFVRGQADKKQVAQLKRTETFAAYFLQLVKGMARVDKDWPAKLVAAFTGYQSACRANFSQVSLV